MLEGVMVNLQSKDREIYENIFTLSHHTLHWKAVIMRPS
jgi:hypothetical protein